MEDSDNDDENAREATGSHTDTGGKISDEFNTYKACTICVLYGYYVCSAATLVPFGCTILVHAVACHKLVYDMQFMTVVVPFGWGGPSEKILQLLEFIHRMVWGHAVAAAQPSQAEKDADDNKQKELDALFAAEFGGKQKTKAPAKKKTSENKKKVCVMPCPSDKYHKVRFNG